MERFIRDFLPAVICFTVFGLDLIVLFFKPGIVDKMVLNVFVGFIPVGRLPATRVFFACFGLLWGIVGLGILLNGLGYISGKAVPIFFLAGFLVVGIGLVYAIFSFARNKPRNKKHK